MCVWQGVVSESGWEDIRKWGLVNKSKKRLNTNINCKSHSYRRKANLERNFNGTKLMYFKEMELKLIYKRTHPNWIWLRRGNRKKETIVTKSTLE